MTFMKEVSASAADIWEQCANGSFLTEMRDGTLSKRKFYDYIVQDSLYLRDYLKAYAMAMFKSANLKEMQTFFSVLNYVNDSENATRLRYLKDCGMTDDDVEKVAKRPQCKAYTEFLIETAVNSEVPEILMAVLPCMLGYYETFMLVKKAAPEIADTYFADLVADYTSQGYEDNCRVWMDFADSICADLDCDRKEKLKKIYIQGCMHELYFWQMAGEDR